MMLNTLFTRMCIVCNSSVMSEQEEEVGKAHLSPAVQWHHWSPQDLALVLAVSLQLPASETAPHYTLAFHYFDPVLKVACTTCVC